MEGASLFVHGYHWLPLATIDLVGDNREIESKICLKLQIPYYHPLILWLLGATNGNHGQTVMHLPCSEKYMVDSLRTLKVHHCLSLVTIGCP